MKREKLKQKISLGDSRCRCLHARPSCGG